MKGEKLITFLLTMSLLAITIHQTESKTERNPAEIIVDKNSGNSKYKTIQKAIDDAKPDTIIYVKAGTYNETININKTITLKGEDKTSIITQQSKINSYTIKIKAPNVKISGFRIQNKAPGLYTMGIKIIGPRTIVENCEIFDTPVGIAIWSSGNTIKNCQFKRCKDEGIALLGTTTSKCNKNQIINCQFYENCDGIELQYSQNNTISNCVFYNNTHAGIDAIASSNNNNIISYCTIKNNEAFGIYITRSSGNKIKQCSITQNPIIITSSTNTTITNSELEKIYLVDTTSMKIENCENIKEEHIKTINSEYKITYNKGQIKNNLETKRSLAYDKIHFLLNLWNQIKLRLEKIRNRFFSIALINTYPFL